MDDTIYHDGYALSLIEGNRNLLVPWYLMASYMYYCQDRPIITDALFDSICKRLDAEWDDIDHWHKVHVDRGSLSAGTCLKLESDYPDRVKGAAWRLVNGPKLVQTSVVEQSAKALPKAKAPAPVCKGKKPKQGSLF